MVELGTGTGAIALSVASEEEGAEVWATDCFAPALRLASANCASVGRPVAARVHLLEGDWFAALPDELAGQVDLLISNPPYVSQQEWTELDDVVRLHDPYEALVPGPSGLEAIALIIGRAPQWMAADGVLALEIGSTQGDAVATLARTAGFSAVRVEPDLSGRDRVLVAHR